MREAPSVVIINKLIKMGAKIRAYDPKSMDIAEKYYFKNEENIEFLDKYEVINGADALLLITEWKEFRSPDFDVMINKMKKGIIFDGRNQYKRGILKKLGLEYYPIGN